MAINQLQHTGKLRKRARQLRYLILNPVEHWRCVTLVRHSYSIGLATGNPLIPYRYLGDYLSLALKEPSRRAALAGHYLCLRSIAEDSGHYSAWQESTLLWEQLGDDEQKYLRIFLEPSDLAPMEGELQLRFSMGSCDLSTITFLFAPGHVFGSSARNVLFIGGAQGGVNCRVETRQACKLNGEISPAAMLMMTIRIMARFIRVDAVVAVCDEDQIAKSYASNLIRLDYHRFWTDAGGIRDGRVYRIPIDHAEKLLSEIPISHRSRTRRKRARKALIREEISARLLRLLGDNSSENLGKVKYAATTSPSSTRR